MNIRNGFKEIIEGWMFIDDSNDLDYRIEEAAKWIKENGPLLPDEEATIKMMINVQFERGLLELGE